MSQTETSEEAPAASLVGSLSVFTLSDVLTLLASTAQTGELQVISASVDGKVWLANGQLSNAHIGAATTIGQAVFELACATDGWFYYTPGAVSSSGQPAVPVDAVLDEVRPQVDEWRNLNTAIPLDAGVTLSPDPPGHDVQIRNDQWQVLATVGTTGHSVREVLDLIGGDQVTGLRTLRDLQTAGLVVLAPLATDAPAAEPPGPATGMQDDVVALAPLSTAPEADLVDTLVDDHAGEDQAPPPLDSAVGQDGGGLGSLAEVTIMPPPIATDPWAPTIQSTGSASNGSGDNGAA
ncbi:MAG: DUF4388 domain-containing protein [Acidimicrobiales bacterium]